MSDQLKFTKSERALLRRLAAEAWNVELSQHLTALLEQFNIWTNSGMNAFELSDKIHEFHNGIARELYGRYTNLDPSIVVSRAIAVGILGKEVLDESLANKLAPEIKYFSVSTSAVEPNEDR